MFFILPVGVDYRARRYPVVTFTLMGLCVLVYLVTLLLELSGNAEAVNEWVIQNLWLIPSESHWWTYLTTLFVHGGFFHLAGNMVYLFLFGSCVEDLIGRFRFTIFYLLSGLAASLAYIAVTPEHFGSEMPLGGASGAISACIGGFLLLLLKTKIEFKWVFFFFFRIWTGEFMLPAWLVISFWFLEDFAMMILTMMTDQVGGGTAFAAHVGGTLFGMGLMAIEKVRLRRSGEDIFDEEIKKKPPVRVMLRPKLVARSDEAPTIHLFHNDAQTGPFTYSQIQEKFVIGEMPLDALYWYEGMDDWRNVDELRHPGS